MRIRCKDNSIRQDLQQYFPLSSYTVFPKLYTKITALSSSISQHISKVYHANTIIIKSVIYSIKSATATHCITGRNIAISVTSAPTPYSLCNNTSANRCGTLCEPPRYVAHLPDDLTSSALGHGMSQRTPDTTNKQDK